MDIIETLREFGEIEWFRIPSFKFIRNNQEFAKFPPVVVWRYANRDQQLAQKIADAVESFDGAVKWIFDSTHKNWVLTPERVKNRNDARILKEIDPEYGLRANAELPELITHIHTCVMNKVNRVYKVDSLNNLLPEIINLYEPLDGFYLLYTAREIQHLALETYCAIILSLHEEDEDYVPVEEELLNFVPVAILDQVSSTLHIALEQKPNAEPQELIDAINYFLDNDAYIILGD